MRWPRLGPIEDPNACARAAQTIELNKEDRRKLGQQLRRLR